jgi:hypothetical protein
MKFDRYDFWKHQNCMDVFFFVHSAYETDMDTTYLVGNWMTQGVESYWMATNQERVIISNKEYANWKVYEPIGVYK